MKKRQLKLNSALKTLIDEKGITLTELSKLTGISYITLKGYFEKGVPIRFSKFINICDKANICIDLFMNQIISIEKGEI